MHHLSTVARSQSQPAFRRTVATISRTRQNPQLTALRRVLGRYWAVTERNIRARCGLLIVERAVDRLHRVLSAFCAFRAFGRESVQAERLGRCAVPMVGRRSTVRFRKGAPAHKAFSIMCPVNIWLKSATRLPLAILNGLSQGTFLAGGRTAERFRCCGIGTGGSETVLRHAGQRGQSKRARALE